MKPLRGVGELVSRGRGSCSLSSTTSSSRRQCGGGGGSGLFLIVTSIYKLCQLSALSASILRLPEQTKTGALRLSQASKLPEQTETGATLKKGGWRRVLLAEAYLGSQIIKMEI